MIPRFEEIRIQALKELSACIVMRAKDLRIPLAKHFGLTEEEMNAWYPSGNGEIFLDRISWALSYLFIAGLVEKPQRGDYKISEKGLTMLSSCTEEQINDFIKETVSAKTPKKNSNDKAINNASSHVGSGSIVAAGALVLGKTEIGPYELWGGVPAKFIKKITPEAVVRTIDHGINEYVTWTHVFVNETETIIP